MVQGLSKALLLCRTGFTTTAGLRCIKSSKRADHFGGFLFEILLNAIGDGEVTIGKCPRYSY